MECHGRISEAVLIASEYMRPIHDVYALNIQCLRSLFEGYTCIVRIYTPKLRATTAAAHTRANNTHPLLHIQACLLLAPI